MTEKYKKIIENVINWRNGILYEKVNFQKNELT